MSKKAFVTGASEGIGRVFARKLAGAGIKVTAVARTEQRLKDLVTSLPGEGHSLLAADLSTDVGIASARSNLERGGYDLLVNNAGFGCFGKFHEVSIEKIERMTRLNCDAVVRLAHAFLKNAKKGDALLNVASLAAFHPMPRNGVYAATKSFVLSLSESLWWEQRERGVFVMALCPGYTLTEFSKRAGADDHPAFKKMAQTPEDVVEAALRALEARRQPVAVSGFHNSATTQLLRFLPRKTVVSIAANAMEKYLKRSPDGGLSNA